MSPPLPHTSLSCHFPPFLLMATPSLINHLGLKPWIFFLSFSLTPYADRKEILLASASDDVWKLSSFLHSQPCIISCLNYCRGLLTFLQLLILLSYSLLSTQHRLDHVTLPLQIFQWLLIFRLKATVLTMTYLTLYLSPPPPPQPWILSDLTTLLSSCTLTPLASFCSWNKPGFLLLQGLWFWHFIS